jgi:hypothetical protein
VDGRVGAAEGEDLVAVKLSKVANDLRLLSSGPRTGFGEIHLPPMPPRPPSPPFPPPCSSARGSTAVDRETGGFDDALDDVYTVFDDIRYYPVAVKPLIQNETIPGRM